MGPLAAIGVAGTALSALGQYRQGKQAYWSAQLESKLALQRANEEKASSQREAMEIDRQGRLAISRALAVAAASGGGASDPTVMGIMADLAGETQYRKMIALYGGESAARNLEIGADISRWQGREARTAGKMAGVTNAMTGFASLYSKYNPTAELTWGDIYENTVGKPLGLAWGMAEGPRKI